MARIKIKATLLAFFSQASTRNAEAITCNDSNAKKQHSLQNIALTLITFSLKLPTQVLATLTIFFCSSLHKPRLHVLNRFTSKRFKLRLHIISWTASRVNGQHSSLWSGLFITRSCSNWNTELGGKEAEQREGSRWRFPNNQVRALTCKMLFTHEHAR